MTDLMGWLYDHYIHPQIENQPQDDARTSPPPGTPARRRSGRRIPNPVFSASIRAEKQDLEYVCRFYAVQGFRAGMKFGLALGEDLKSL